MRHIKEFGQLFESQQELTQEQKDWLDECTYCTDSNWWINPQTGLVDVDGSFDCEELGLSDFKGVRFGAVEDYFDCRDNQLTSLEGAPLSVGGNFYCPFNTISAETLNGVIVMMSDKKITLEQAVSDLWNQIPEEDRTYLAKHHPELSPEEKREYAALERMKTRVI